MINHHHGLAGSDDPDESPDAAAYDDRGQFLAQDHRHHPSTLWQDPEGCETPRRIHGSGPGTEMFPQSAQIDMQVCQHLLSGFDKDFLKCTRISGLTKIFCRKEIKYELVFTERLVSFM